MVSVIIVAGGKGLRMGNSIPKQFLPICDKPILMRTIDKYYNHPQINEVIVVLPLEQIEYWNELCKKYVFTSSHKIIHGGKTRFHSVKNGLTLIENNSHIILVHDAVRPFVSIALITKTIETAKIKGAVIPVVDVVDSIRKLNSDGTSSSIDRELIKKVQTPQGFTRNILISAYNQNHSSSFTDDASVVEAEGQRITLIAGEDVNIKITTEIDMFIAKDILCNEKRTLKTH